MSSEQSRRDFLRGSAITAAGLAVAGSDAVAAGHKKNRKIVVWSEDTLKKVYPNDINTAIAEGLQGMKGWDVVTASLNDPEQGLPDSLLAETSVLVWWGHQRHGEVKDELVAKCVDRIKAGTLGFIPTHSSHYSKIFKTALNAPCGWEGGVTADGAKLHIIVKDPKHPIAKGIVDFDVPHTERYLPPFTCSTWDDLVFDGEFTRLDGVKQESPHGATWTVGKGRIFYFQPGHETFPIYYQPEIRAVFRNAVGWVAPKKA